MPNWCDNCLTIYGTVSERGEFLRRACAYRRQYKESSYIRKHMTQHIERQLQQEVLSFNAFVPIPDGLLNRTYGAEAEIATANKAGITLEEFDGCTSGYDWEAKNWGVKWGASDTNITGLTRNATVYRFSTPWGPPIKWIQKVSEMYPRLKFRISYNEPGCRIKGIATFEGGLCTSEIDRSHR